MSSLFRDCIQNWQLCQEERREGYTKECANEIIMSLGEYIASWPYGLCSCDINYQFVKVNSELSFCYMHSDVDLKKVENCNNFFFTNLEVYVHIKIFKTFENLRQMFHQVWSWIGSGWKQGVHVFKSQQNHIWGHPQW